MSADAIRHIAVIGAGQMGSGIAQVAAAKAIDVALVDAEPARARAALANLSERLSRLVEKGKLEAARFESIRSNIRALAFEEAVANAELVIEAASEDLHSKIEIFKRADACAPEAAVLASNTSSISITKLAAVTRRPEQVVGMHFMNPVPLMKLVELVRGVATSAATLSLVRGLAERLEKTVILSNDSPGFIVNRMLLPLLNEACFALQEGVANAEDIDAGARLGLNHPLGPLELADLIGLDTVLSIADVLKNELGDDKYRAPTLLRNLVAAGHLGRKSGRGFYRYDGAGKKLGQSAFGSAP